MVKSKANKVYDLQRHRPWLVSTLINRLSDIVKMYPSGSCRMRNKFGIRAQRERLFLRELTRELTFDAGRDAM